MERLSALIAVHHDLQDTLKANTFPLQPQKDVLCFLLWASKAPIYSQD